MPRITDPTTRTPEDDEHDEHAALLADREAFGAGFRRGPSGSLTQHLTHAETGRLTRMTVFHKWGRWYYVTDDGTDEPRFSCGGGYEDEDCAIGDLWRDWRGMI